MTQIKRINTDRIGANPRSVAALLFPWTAIGLTTLVLVGCHKESTSNSSTAVNENAAASSSGLNAAAICDRYRALDNSHDSTIKMRARISGFENAEALNAPRQLQLTIYRKHEPDGRIVVLIEFTSPVEERDRDGLITAFPDGRIEAVRYVQSTDSFIVTSDPTGEDALFGMTPQELAEGQPEKYEFSLLGDDTYNGEPVYRLKGTLRPRAESKFPGLELLISKQSFAALQADFFDNHNELARRLTVSKSQMMTGHWTRLAWTIDNRARQKKIDFEAVDVKYDQNLSDSLFTREHLKKIASR